ncbi:GGDEF domain-containing protein [Butyrivibrio sp. VCD2006]|uniref:GGDEF domain-containing protein n=1 Tax=Butyrivibrio sp. VCD2006 TaxID=1280664 RepID=UPI00040F6995|nr:GGDEF domain-containing protein [Butyrivibrio sp. VCD2006]
MLHAWLAEHELGDEALKALADVFHKNSDTGLLYGRWGGEEFLLIAPENVTYAEFVDLLENIRKQIEGLSLKSGGMIVKFTISIGAATYKKGMTSEKLVNSADDRLYAAKESGRNKVVYE